MVKGEVMKRVVFTGAPGAGKTAVLLALRDAGHAVVDESARAVIRERRALGLSPRPSPREFAQEVLARDIAKYRSVNAQAGWTFFDRAVPDALCMLNHTRALTKAALAADLSAYPYHRQVFVFPPWAAIYRTDAERDQTLEQARHAHRALVNWYRRCGYEVCSVPKLPVAQRCAFILQALG